MSDVNAMGYRHYDPQQPQQNMYQNLGPAADVPMPGNYQQGKNSFFIFSCCIHWPHEVLIKVFTRDTVQLHN